MKHFCFSALLIFFAFVSRAQAPLRPGSGLVVGRLEDFIEATKRVAEASATAKSPAEARPALNRLLVMAAFDFVQITRNAPSREAYLQAIDHGLNRVEALMATVADRREIAEFYVDLMDIVGVDSSDGRLDAFVARPLPAPAVSPTLPTPSLKASN